MTSLLLKDGTVLTGKGFGAEVDADGEVVFNTGMAGYPESLTDPSYRGQILVFTYPLIGNYGVPTEDLNEWGFSKVLESEAVHVRGVICAELSEEYSHHAAKQSLAAWLKKHSIPGITGIDTRMLTKKLRETGVMLGRIAQDDASRDVDGIVDPNIENVVAQVSCSSVETYKPKPDVDCGLTIVAYDCGMKRNIIRSFLNRGVTVVRVPWDYDLAAYKGDIDGFFCSNGPGDPKRCVPTINSFKLAISRNIPTFGICLGNQLLALAVGGDTYKLPYGHRGANQPCIEWKDGKATHRCIITSQNHGFAVSDKLPKGWNVWFTNANDGTVEGIRHESGLFFSVQFHPESTPGPEDAGYLFDEFVNLMKSEKR